MNYFNIRSRRLTCFLRQIKLALFAVAFLYSGLAFAASPASVSEAPVLEAPVLDLSGTEGKVVYIDFWASWCAPCQASFSYMNQLKSQYSESDFEIILVNLDQNKKKAERFLRRVEEPVPSIYDPKGVIAKHYKVSAMPTSILIDRTGKIRYVHKGFHLEKTNEYSSHIKELIDEK